MKNDIRVSLCIISSSRTTISTHRFGRIAILLEFFLAGFSALQFDLCVGEGRVGVSKVAIEPKTVLHTRALVHTHQIKCAQS